MGNVNNIDDIMREVLAEIEGAAKYKLTDGAKNEFLDRYKPRFKRRLDEVHLEGWYHEEEGVRKAARTHGKCAALLADLAGRKEINNTILMGLAPLIQNLCETGAGEEGAWCSGFP
jgi:hypothetical protein